MMSVITLFEKRSDNIYIYCCMKSKTSDICIIFGQ